MSHNNPPSSPTPSLGHERRALLLLAAPIVAQNLANEGMSFVDTLMAGRISTATLAGIAVGGAMWVPVMLFMMGTIMALSPMVAHAYGHNDRAAIGRRARQGLWLALGISVPAFFGLRHAAPLLHAFDVAPNVVPAAMQYLHGVVWGLPAMGLFFVLRFTSEGMGHTRPLLWIAGASVLTNAGLDYCFMYHPWQWGAYGCGLATALTMVFMFIAMLGYSFWARRLRAVQPFARLDIPSPALLGEWLALGVPIGLAIFMEVSLFSAIALIMSNLGETIVAAHQVALNFAALMFMVPMGISMAITVRVGQALGRGESVLARHIGWMGIRVCMAFMAASAIAMVLFPATITGWYTDNSAVQRIAIGLLGMAAIFQLSDGLQVSAAGVLRGYKDTHIPMWITALAYWLIGVPLAWALGVGWQLGPRAVWGGFIAGLSVAALLLTARVWRLSRRPPHTL